ncbi:MAG: radical SAM protein [Desulfobacteraceae bacterium]|nr:radical SAM protein [Desulfobacteraceae bacterium]
MKNPTIALIHPPVVKPSEPPAGIARLAGALRAHGVNCTVIDANIEGLCYLLDSSLAGEDTWSRRAHRHLGQHLNCLRNPQGYPNADQYRRAVADLGRVLSQAGRREEIKVGLGDYEDAHLTPVRRDHLLRAAQEPRRNPFHNYFYSRLLPRLAQHQPVMVGISINYLSQALCGFALAGLIRQTLPEVKLALGGGLITSWMRRPQGLEPFAGLIDTLVAGPGEWPLLQALGRPIETRRYKPDYSDLSANSYFSPGFILPFSASNGCWWRRCDFCPEQAEGGRFHPLPHSFAIVQLQHLVAQTRPRLIHLLDNAISPALLRRLADQPPGAPWYGFVRIGPPLDDPIFCHGLAQSGCVMLKIGLESGSQQVLDRLHKGIQLNMATRVLDNLRTAGIAAYVYLLFGTPAEDEAAAQATLDFVVDHHEAIDFLNTAIFNLPIGGPDAQGLQLRDFYDGDLAMYRDFIHPSGWQRAAVRRFVEKIFKKHPAIQPIIRRDPPVFTSNHAAFFTTAGLQSNAVPARPGLAQVPK